MVPSVNAFFSQIFFVVGIHTCMKNLRILELGLSGIVIRRRGPLIIGSRTDVAILALLKILGIAQATLLVL